MSSKTIDPRIDEKGSLEPKHDFRNPINETHLTFPIEMFHNYYGPSLNELAFTWWDRKVSGILNYKYNSNLY